MNEHFTLPAAELAARVQDARERTLSLVSDLDTAQLSVPPLEHVNPIIWELGHVAFFYETFLLRELGRTEPVIEGGEDLYDSFTVDHDDRWSLPLPSREETLDYMRRVAQLVVGRLDSREPSARETYLYLLAALHEDMHGEALAYTRQTLGYPPPRVVAGEDARPGEGGPCPGDAEIPGGRYRLGAEPGAPFVFDNEKWAHPVEVEPFRIARAPVTNAQFAEFVDARGYLRRELWDRQGWQWRTSVGAQHPQYWRRDANGWLRVHFDRVVPLEEHAPLVHVSWHEARAFCNWADRRLPSEAEWELAASAEPQQGGGIGSRKRRYPWGDEPPGADRANLDSRLVGCVEVGAFAAGDSAFGCRQMLGNVWEWTASAFYPYPGYVVDTPYREYSAPWFGDRMVLRGGAWATRSRLVNNTYRNFFPPSRSDVFAGFRTCAR